MKPVLMRHVEPRNESFKAWKNGNPYIRIPWHYHPECEITYIHKGKGCLFVGDKMLKYGTHDIVLIGPNLPHEWRNDICNPDFFSETISAHFKKKFLGEPFFQLSEVKSITNLLEKSSRGIKIDDRNRKTLIKEKMLMLPKTEGIAKINTLLQILDIISGSPNLTYLSSSSFAKSINFSQDSRINQVYEYVMKNFPNSISISDVAHLINMNDTSFCRFFKERTNKTFISYLNEIRIGYACKLLLERNLSVSQIAYESGFNNISYFNKQFKNVKKTTPTGFKKRFFEKNNS